MANNDRMDKYRDIDWDNFKWWYEDPYQNSRA